MVNDADTDAPSSSGPGEGTTGWSDAEMATFIDDLSPYPALYDDQRDGIRTVREAGLNDGYAVIEGACGTGKTLMAVLGGLSLIRDDATQYERIVCLTSVKQQLRAFENDVAAINEALRGSDDL